MTAVDGRLDVEIVGGARLGRGIDLFPDGTAEVHYSVFDNHICPATGVAEQFVFDYVFNFHPNGIGSATAHWTYGFNTNCAVCAVDDAATLRRVAGP